MAARNIRKADSGAGLRQNLRLASGLVLLTFAFTHFLNHMLGIWSLEAMEAGRLVFLAVWRSAPGEAVLLASLLTHVSLTLWKTGRRRTLRLSVWQWAQLLLGLGIPFLLIPHAIGTGGLAERFGYEDTYKNVLSILWPGLVLNQTVLMLLVWTHGMIGLHFWLRVKPGYKRWFPMLLSVALVVPVLASWGWIATARRLKLTENVPFPLTGEMIAWSDPLIMWLKWGFYGLVGLALAIVALRMMRRRFVQTIEITYPGDRKVRSPAGPTLLEISRMNGIPHADVCGGRARCSTCRTRILDGADTLPPPAANEQKVLARIGAQDDIRLACQIRPQSALKVQPLVPARGATKASGLAGDAYQWGVEQPAAILFVDLRNFTGLSEHRLSYDVVFLLNRYLGETAHAIEACGGYVDKFIGDGVMAIFGMTDGLQAGCRNALAATNAIAERMEHLNAELAGQLDAPLRVGMGLHAGPVILGRIGALDTNGANARITALGDVVNTASRLESSSKELGHALVVSTTVLTSAGYSCDATREREIPIRGRKDPLRVYALDPPSPLADMFAPAAKPSS